MIFLSNLVYYFAIYFVVFICCLACYIGVVLLTIFCIKNDFDRRNQVNLVAKSIKYDNQYP